MTTEAKEFTDELIKAMPQLSLEGKFKVYSVVLGGKEQIGVRVTFKDGSVIKVVREKTYHETEK